MIAATAAARPRPWWQFAMSGVALAGAVAVIVPRILADSSDAEQLALDLPIIRRGPAVRSTESAHVGDVVRVRARGGGGYRAVWVYHGDDLVTACPGAPSCRFIGDATIAEVELRWIGSYEVIAMTSAVPVAPPLGKLDTDVANAQSAGAAVTHKPLIVR